MERCTTKVGAMQVGWVQRGNSWHMGMKPTRDIQCPRKEGHEYPNKSEV